MKSNMKSEKRGIMGSAFATMLAIFFLAGIIFAFLVVTHIFFPFFLKKEFETKSALSFEDSSPAESLLKTSLKLEVDHSPKTVMTFAEFFSIYKAKVEADVPEELIKDRVNEALERTYGECYAFKVEFPDGSEINYNWVEQPQSGNPSRQSILTPTGSPPLTPRVSVIQHPKFKFSFKESYNSCLEEKSFEECNTMCNVKSFSDTGSNSQTLSGASEPLQGREGSTLSPAEKKYKIELLLVPAGEWESQDAANKEGKKIADFFIDNLPLKDCRSKVYSKIGNVNVFTKNDFSTAFQGNDDPSSSLFAFEEYNLGELEWAGFVRKKLDALGYEPDKFNLIFPIFQGDSESPTSLDTLLHEFSHSSFGFGDQYCSYLSPGCNSLLFESDGCDPSVNMLKKELGCNPASTNPNDPNVCCGISAGISPDLIGDGVCCLGNKVEDKGKTGRSIMSANINRENTFFDPNEKKILSSINYLKCSTDDIAPEKSAIVLIAG